MRISSIFWAFFLGLLIFLSFNYHGKAPSYTHRSQIWADKAGYQVYLPFTIIYGANANAMPDSIATLTGGGFSINSEKNILHNKYTYGVALMQLPFFLTAHYLSNGLGFEPSGYSKIYNWAVDVSAVFYLVYALIILSKVLLVNYTKKTVFITLTVLFLGSNLFYYTIDETGMSHIYSFFLFTLFLSILQKTQFLKINTVRWSIYLGLVVALITIVRPLNIIILTAFLLWQAESKTEIIERIKRVFQTKTLAILLLCFSLIWLPQLLFWKYSEGSYFHYSYGDEGFNWLKPELLKVWFSPNSGAFLYGSLSLVVLILSIRKTIENWNKNGYYLFVFIVVSFVSSCWWIWSFGCSYGMRNLTEYYALFVFLLAPFIGRVLENKGIKRGLMLGVFIAVIALNIQISYSYGGCYLGNGDWDFQEYFRLVSSF